MHALPYHDTVGTGPAAYGWPTVAFPTPQPLTVQYPYPHQRGWCKQEQDAGVPSHTRNRQHPTFSNPRAFNNNLGRTRAVDARSGAPMEQSRGVQSATERIRAADEQRTWE
ncbi:hypothetical protein HPP92_011446 [Vanilla planifolia]|uniref:Uncharacterized protein n=1 Tax=Vanilla planifolia TaxID=51239 RepID=A0A835RBI8_VANPL|nr:hypothetical protein HPP92_011446 [Vanilla planifolia]